MSTAKCGDGAVVKVLNRQKSTLNTISWKITFYFQHFKCIQTYNFLQLSPHSLIDLRRPVRPGQLPQRVDEPGHHFTGLLWWVFFSPQALVGNLIWLFRPSFTLATLSLSLLPSQSTSSELYHHHPLSRTIVTNHCYEQLSRTIVMKHCHEPLSRTHPTRQPSARWCATMRSCLQVQIWEIG